MSEETITKHFNKLQSLANRRRGKLPTAKWLNAHGFFHSYDVVRKAGLLGMFERSFAY